jgi:hypothetical protein
MLTRTRAGIVVAFAILDGVFLYWLWANFSNWGIWDWDYYQTLIEAERTTLLDFGQLPLWNPYLGGGVPLIGNPMRRPLAPNSLAPLLFGTIAGIKINVFLYMLIGQLGMYALARNERLGRSAAALAAILFSLGGCFAQHLTHGHYEWLAFWWLPLVVLALHRAAERWSLSRVIFGGIALALLFMDGGPYEITYSLLLLGPYALLLSLRDRSPHPIGAAGAFVLIALALTAYQLLPVTEGVLQLPRATPTDRAFYGAPWKPGALEILFRSYLSRVQHHDPEQWMSFALNVGCYVGLVPLLLALVGLVRDRARVWPLGVAGLSFVWISLGPAAPWDVWALLHHLPVLSSLQVPSRLNTLVLFCLALVAARGLEAIRSWTPRGCASAVLAVVVIDMIMVNAPIFEAGFSVRPLDHEPRGRFEQYSVSPYSSKYPGSTLLPIYPHWPNAAYPAILENAGVIHSQRALRYPRNALACRPPKCVHEIWSRGDDVEVVRVDFTPNRVTIDSAGAGGTLLVNQNFHTGWRVEGGLGGTKNLDGLLAVDVGPGPQTVTFTFLPSSFLIGAGVSLTAWTLIALALTRARGRDAPEKSPDTEAEQLGARRQGLGPSRP